MAAKKKATLASGAVDALVKYGWVEGPDGTYTRFKGRYPTDKWEETKGGFLRFHREDGAWVPVPYTVIPCELVFDEEHPTGVCQLKHSPHWAKLSGYTFEDTPEAYEMVYPEDHVYDIYHTALQEAS